MIEIGKTREVVVRRRDKSTGKLTPQFEPNGCQVTKVVANEVWRVTREELGGHFGRDRARKLVVGLLNGDLIALRPAGTRQQVVARIRDVYSWMLRTAALRIQLAKARETKIRREAARERRRLNHAERRLREPIKETA